MTKEETYKKALEKISKYGIKPDGETEWQRIKRLKSIADKALFIADVIVPCCEPIGEGFFLGTSCPKCKRPFRQVIE